MKVYSSNKILVFKTIIVLYFCLKRQSKHRFDDCVAD